MEKSQKQPTEKKSIAIRIEDFLEHYEIRHPWYFWLITYFIFAITAIFLAFVFSNFFFSVLNRIDVNSARYLLSSLIQSQAAIIAIVITLTLIAVQTTSTQYSPRVTKIYSQSPHMVLLLVSYILSITFGAVLLQLFEGIEGPIHPLYAFFTSLSLWLAIVLAVALIPYIFYSLQSLNPERITKKIISTFNENSNISIGSERDSFELVFDIIHSSIMRNDLTTVRRCTGLLTPHILEVISEKKTDEENNETVKIYMRHLSQCARQAANLKDDQIVHIILENVFTIACHTAKKGLDNTSYQIFDDLLKIEKECFDNDLKDPLHSIEDLLFKLGSIVIENDLKESTYKVYLCFETIGKHAVARIDTIDRNNPYDWILYSSYDLLEKLGNFAIEKKNNNAISMVFPYLYGIGEYAFKKEQISIVHNVAMSIIDLWEECVKNGIEVPSIMRESYLAYHAYDYDIKRDGHTSYQYEEKLLRIAIVSNQKKLDHSKDNAVNLLRDLRKVSNNYYPLALQRLDDELGATEKQILKEISDLVEK